MTSISNVGSMIYNSRHPEEIYRVSKDENDILYAQNPNNGVSVVIPKSYFYVDEWHFCIAEAEKKKQVGGTHYTDLEIQPWEVIKRNKMGFFDGTALKYIMRYRQKNGVEDLKKAVHTLEELISQLEGKDA